MPIHEKSLIRPENLKTHEKLVLDGVDVSGHWSTFIEPRVVTDYNERLQEEIAALPGGEHIHRCWQCGSCTNSCTVHAVNPDFNPRYWIYLIRMGMESELLRDKEIIWQCVSCNKCTYACPRDVFPEGVMKATAHWLALKGHTPKKPVDDLRRGVHRAGGGDRQNRRRPRDPPLLRKDRPAAPSGLAGRNRRRRVARRLPILQGIKLALAAVFRPRTRGWARAGAAIAEYVHEQERRRRKALGLEDRA
ncbi:MAG: 4Fe-4S dicluster domain-containing protein [Burkholderiales bacterium]|nr:4Fe-4S dicluster domain-containing protein [Burkholderiales bacterium]